MLSISSHDSVTRIDDRLHQISSRGDADFLQIPQNFDDLCPGAEVSIVQLILTWAAFSTTKTLVTGIAQQVDANQSLQNLAAQPCGRIALLSAGTVQTANGITMEDATKAIHESVPPPLQIRGNDKGASLIVRSALSEPRGHAAFLRLATDGARGEKREVFNRHIMAALSAFRSKTHTIPLHAGSAELAEILYELFSNAEEWGCTNVNAAPIRLPLRGILFRLHDASTVRISQADHGLATYLERERKNSEISHFLEVSVFDSGIGLAQRFLRKQIHSTDTIQSEFDAVRECFAKHGTSTATSFRGLGLFYIILLSSRLRGFLRLRTGRLHLYRDFVADEYHAPAFRTPVARSVLSGFQYLRDWTTNFTEPDKIVAHPYAKGAVYNIFLPMKTAQRDLFDSK